MVVSVQVKKKLLLWLVWVTEVKETWSDVDIQVDEDYFDLVNIWIVKKFDYKDSRSF